MLTTLPAPPFRLAALPRKYCILVVLAVLFAVALLAAPDLVAQTKMSDNTEFGEGGYFNAIVFDGTVSFTMCWVAGMLRWIIIGCALVMAMWKGYKAADGMGAGWKSLIIYLLVAGMMAAPSSLFGSKGYLHVRPVAAFLTQCGIQ